MESAESNARPSSGSKPARSLWKAVIAVVLIVAVLIAAVVGLILSGIMYAGFKTPQQEVMLRVSVCNDKDVNDYKYNLTQVPLKESAGKIEGLFNDIKNRPGNDQDPTCQYILYFVATLFTKDGAQQYLDNVKKLSSQGIYPNNTVYDTFIERLKMQ